MKKVLLFFAAAVVCFSGLIIWLRNGDKESLKGQISVSEALSDTDTSGYKRALYPVEFVFPLDHGPHEEFKTEWWYFTGNLDASDGRHLGYQLTIFRTAVASGNLPHGSDWRSKDIYMGHFAVTDVMNNKFYSAERFSRSGNKLAGAASAPFSVWLYDWQIKGSPDGLNQTGGIIQLSAEDNGISVQLKLKNLKPLVIQGENGLSRKGPGRGNASYYYSFTRLATEGLIRIKENSFSVKGSSWFDREWSTSSLNKDQSGWDWFSLQLSNNKELMYYRIRKNDGTEDKYSSCRLISENGLSKNIPPENVRLTVTDYYESRDGVRYPSAWKLDIPEENIILNIVPYINNQELDVSVRYWEGAVKVRGTVQNTPLSGNGYVELTGYSSPGYRRK